MDFDFEFFLLAGTLISGMIWGGWLWWFRKSGEAKEPLVVEYAHSFFPILLIVLVLRSFVVEPFRIPSGSMMSTLLVGDFILVNKFVYGIRLPVIHTKVIEVSEPERGDIVVFRYPNNPSVDYIKRVIGLPGDHIAYYNKKLYVNGEPVPLKSLGTYVGVGQNQRYNGAMMYQEKLGEAQHQILVMPGQSSVEGEYVVPQGHYFVMGDNRDNSNDSRYWGPVPEKNLVGEAFFIWMHWEPSNPGVIFDRIGTVLQ
ncbi:MAG: signal peptidase I [Methylohalobius sp. ZOD2]